MVYFHIKELEEKVMTRLNELNAYKFQKKIKVGLHTRLKLCGPSEEWNNLMENTLNDIFNEADKTAQGDFDEIKRTVENFVQIIRSKAYVKDKEYIEETDLPEDNEFPMEKKTDMLHMESIDRDEAETMKGLQLALECTSLEELRHVWNLFQKGGATEHMNKIAEALSEHFGVNVSLKAHLDIDEFKTAIEETVGHQVFEERENQQNIEDLRERQIFDEASGEDDGTISAERRDTSLKDIGSKQMMTIKTAIFIKTQPDRRSDAKSPMETRFPFSKETSSGSDWIYQVETRDPLSKGNLLTSSDSKTSRCEDVNDEQKQCEMPTLSRPHDGRLIELQPYQLEGLMSNCEKKVIHGGFGDVYISKTEVPGLDVRIVIKRIICKGKDKMKMLSATNEKIASRIMHFAIVPVIAYMDKDVSVNERGFFFISPYLEKGSLFEMISKDKRCKDREDIVLKRYRRKQILFQIASALDYLHKPVPGVRGITLHMDLTSTNVVLDKKLNARLIDFGLAREMNEGETKATFTESETFGTPGYYPTKRYSKLTISEDYYNFGVVIRELLTGREPFREDGIECYELRKESVGYIRKTLQDNIWAGCEETLDLIELSKECLESREENVMSEKLFEKMQKIRVCPTQCPTEQEDKCDICMVNDAVNSGQSPPHQCLMSVYVSCMRNSHVNPLKCRVCNNDVIPTIGHTYAAVLIAGNDRKDETLAKSFRQQVAEIKEVLISKYPCVIGIREENVKTIVPCNPGQPEVLLPQWHSSFVSLQRKTNLKTLLVYFTGHYFKESGFMLGGPTDILTVADIQQQLEYIWKAWGKTTRILAFLDCCNAPNVGSVPEVSKEHVKIIQINACASNEAITQSSSNSNFQRFFIQALTRKAFKKNCYSSISSANSPEDECKDCKMTGDFISVEQLLEYISEHMKKCLFGKQPVMYTNGINWLDTSIGYNIDFLVNISFKLELGSEIALSVPLNRQVYCDISKMKESVLDIFIENHDFSEKIKATPVQFADALALRVQTGSEGGTELGSVLNVSGAWDAKREIIASYRVISSILKGRVVLFMPTKFVSTYLEEKELTKNETDREVELRFSFTELDRANDEIKKDIDSHKMSIEDSEVLKKFNATLVQVYDKWERGTEKHRRALRIIFPRIEDVRFEEFCVLDLSVAD